MNGLQIGSVYILFALGLTLTFGVMKVVNFAYGALLAMGAYVAFVILSYGNDHLPGTPAWALYLVSFLVATVVLGVIGVALYYLFFKRFAGDLISTLIVTIGFALVVEVLTQQFFTAQPPDGPDCFLGQDQPVWGHGDDRASG